MGDQPDLVLIGSGLRDYREYLLRSIATAYRVQLISDVDATWERQYLHGFTKVPDASEEAIVGAAQRIATQVPVAGVLTWHEERIIQAARVGEALGLPGSSVAAVRRCRDKYATRSVLTSAGILQPRFALAASVSEAQDAADRLGFPVVVKPRGAGGSQGVALVASRADLSAYVNAALGVKVSDRAAFAGDVLIEEGVLLEEYVDGPEISVDSAVVDGRVTPVFVAQKEVGFPPFFEETGHLVGATDPLVSDAGLAALLGDIHRSLGYTHGWTHCELRLGPAGPVLIEVNGRLGGDLIPYLGWKATGTDPGLAAAAIACGKDPDLVRSADRIAGIRFFYPPIDDAVVETLSFAAEDLPADIDLCRTLVEEGACAALPHIGFIDSRIALAVAVSASAPECRAALGGAGRALRLSVRRASPLVG